MAQNYRSDRAFFFLLKQEGKDKVFLLQLFEKAMEQKMSALKFGTGESEIAHKLCNGGTFLL